VTLDWRDVLRGSLLILPGLTISGDLVLFAISFVIMNGLDLRFRGISLYVHGGYPGDAAANVSADPLQAPSCHCACLLPVPAGPQSRVKTDLLA